MSIALPTHQCPKWATYCSAAAHGPAYAGTHFRQWSDEADEPLVRVFKV